jgi:RimJ/RimL family protein N-acetyltransferase
LPAEQDARIATARLELVPVLREHANELFSVLSDPRLYEFTHEAPPGSVAELQARYSFLESRRSPDGTQAWLNWILFELATGSSIGYVQATVEARQADIAWVVGTPWQRRGYATEAVAAMIVWLHGAGVQVVRAKVHPLHIASQRVAAKAGLALTRETVDGENVWVRQL